MDLQTTSESSVENMTDYEYEEICNKTSIIQFGALVTPIFFIAVIVLSCVGNVLVVWVLVKYENLKSLTNTYLLNLAFSDLIFTFGLPFWVSYFTSNGWTLGDVACKAVNFVFYTGYFSSIIFMTVLTVHRYVAVVHPMSVVMSRKSLKCYVISGVIWLLSLCTAVPQAIFNSVESVPYNTSILYCDFHEQPWWKNFCTYMQNCFFIAAFLIIVFCYAEILLRLLRPTSHTRKKTLWLILCIVVFFFLGWGPYNAAIFLNAQLKNISLGKNICQFDQTVDYVINISRILAFSHCCLNPVFYVFMGVKFRRHLNNTLWTLCKKGREVQSRQRIFSSNGEDISIC